MKTFIIAIALFLISISTSCAQEEISFTDGGTLVIGKIEDLLSKGSINKIKKAAKEDSTKSLSMLVSYLKNQGYFLVPDSYRNWIDETFEQKRLNCRMLILYKDWKEMKYDTTDDYGDIYGSEYYTKSLNDYEIDRLVIACRKN